jgi:hypothetical protein
VAWMQNKSNLDFGSCYPFATQIILLLKNWSFTTKLSFYNNNEDQWKNSSIFENISW